MRSCDRGAITVLASWRGTYCLTGVLLANVAQIQLQSSLTSSLTVTCLWGWKVSGLSSQCSKMSETDLVAGGGRVLGGGEQCKIECLGVSHRLSFSEYTCGSVNSTDRNCETLTASTQLHLCLLYEYLMTFGKWVLTLRLGSHGIVQAYPFFGILHADSPQACTMDIAHWGLHRFLNTVLMKPASPETNLDGNSMCRYRTKYSWFVNFFPVFPCISEIATYLNRSTRK